MNYEEDVKIDHSQLDIEWLEQTSLAMRYGEEFADAKRDVSDAIEKVKIIKAKLVRRANKKPDKCLGKGIKATAPVVEAYYRSHADHMAAKEDLIEKEHTLTIIEIAKNEISFTRKTALENLVKLYNSQYFAGPEMPRELDSEWEQHEKQKRANNKVKLNRKKKG